ncbi:hypothetical protein AB0D74_47995 [Streptomyces sp. NPDC048278]
MLHARAARAHSTAGDTAAAWHQIGAAFTTCRRASRRRIYEPQPAKAT